MLLFEYYATDGELLDVYLKKIQENQKALCFERKTIGKAKLTLSRLLGSLWAVSRVEGSARYLV